ncbi:hypothetical protein OJ967_12255 [Peribacillus frigoritolerans]|uniref:hypothetical protein n=1 Tax=Peribacillus frigoritolerans TaxID=450367 RepID=UPI002226C7C5|nr:hypothetical protein [Peribacillus frigoritolerans]UYZ01195.1 hypothetical protein OJ967_12255 [Peribacillus frigoritolerans]
MKMAIHYSNGETVTDSSFNGVDPKQTANEMFAALEEIKRNNSPMVFTDNASGEQIRKEGKDLVSVEFILE